jgi:hypothetical protein
MATDQSSDLTPSGEVQAKLKRRQAMGANPARQLLSPAARETNAVE